MRIMAIVLFGLSLTACASTSGQYAGSYASAAGPEYPYQEYSRRKCYDCFQHRTDGNPYSH